MEVPTQWAEGAWRGGPKRGSLGGLGAVSTVGELRHKSWWLELCPLCSVLLRVGEEHMGNSLQTVLERESVCRGVNAPSASSEE